MWQAVASFLMLLPVITSGGIVEAQFEALAADDILLQFSQSSKLQRTGKSQVHTISGLACSAGCACWNAIADGSTCESRIAWVAQDQLGGAMAEAAAAVQKEYPDICACPGAEPFPIGSTGLLGHYGILSDFSGSEAAVQDHVAKMKSSFGIFEFQLACGLAGFSAPPGDELTSWSSVRCARQVKRSVLKAAAAAAAKDEARSWLLVGADTTDRGDAALQEGAVVLGSFVWDAVEVDVVALDSAWARRVAPRWVSFAKSVSATGIHWDTVGAELSRGSSQAGAVDIPGFLRTSIGILRDAGLLQTLNFVDGYGWDATLFSDFGPGWVGRAIAFPYWTTRTALSGPAPSPVSQGSGDQYIVSSQDRCLDAQKAQVTDCAWQSTSQQWRFDNGQFRSNTGKCLRLQPHADWLLEVSACQGSEWEMFSYSDKLQVMSTKTGRCLDHSVFSGAVYMNPCDQANPYQHWLLATPFAGGGSNTVETPWEIKPQRDDPIGRGTCVGVDNDGSAQLQACGAEAHLAGQRWTFDDTTGQLRNQYGSCLQVSASQDWLLQAWVCIASSSRQQWAYDQQSRQLSSKFAVTCLDHNPYADDPNKLSLTQCQASNDNQRWSLVKFDPVDYLFQGAFGGQGFVWSCFPGFDARHIGEPWNSNNVGEWPVDIGIKRWQQAVRNGGTYLLIGNGNAHVQGASDLSTSAMGSADISKVQHAVALPPVSQPLRLSPALSAAGGASWSVGPVRWAQYQSKCLHPHNMNAGSTLEWRECGDSPAAFIVPHNSGEVRLAAAPSLCLDVAGGRSTNGNPLQLWYCGTSRFQMPEDGQGVIRWEADPSKCVSVAAGSQSDGAATAAQIWDCTGPGSLDTERLQLPHSLAGHPQSLMVTSWKSASTQHNTFSGMRGHYGFLAHFNVEPATIRARVTELADKFGLLEFQLYDAFEGYSHPPSSGAAQWSHNTQEGAIGALVRRDTLSAAIDEITNRGGRSWFYVQSVGCEPKDYDAVAGGFVDAGCYKHGGSCASFNIIVPNAAWAMRITPQWAEFAAGLGVSGIHWDTLGSWENRLPANNADFPGFLRAAAKILGKRGLSQTLNFVNGYGWDPSLIQDFGPGWAGRVIAFPYWEVWTQADEEVYRNSVWDLHGGFVMAEYPGYDACHCSDRFDQQTNGHLSGTSPLDVGIQRFQDCAAHGGSYVFIGDGHHDGPHRLQGMVFSQSASMTAAEVLQVQAQVSLPPTPVR